MAGIRSLVKDTAIYGISSIVGRLLNYPLTTLYYTHVFAPGAYGIVGTLYSYTGVWLVLLNYGMETGLFRFVSIRKNPQTVYTTSLFAVGTTSVVFMVLITLFSGPIASAIRMNDHRLLVWLLGITVAIDAFSNIPFAYMRFMKRAKRFATIKLLNIVVCIALNIFFITVCPYIETHCGKLIEWFYKPLGGEDFGIGWIFIANIISSILMLLMLVPEMLGLRWKFDGLLLRKMLKFSFPILITGVAGTFAHNMGQIFIPYLYGDVPGKAEIMVGLYSANIKIAVILTMFTQAFRYAYEPFVFSNSDTDIHGRNQAYCDAMKYFVIFTLLIFMSVMFFLPIIQYLIGEKYRSGLNIVPIVMGAEICFGIYYNLSIWYKLTDRTIWGTWFSLITFIMITVLNVILVRFYGDVNGYVGSAWASLISYAAVMILCWFVGRFYYPLNYPIWRILWYTFLVLLMTYAGLYLSSKLSIFVGWSVKISLLCWYIIIILRKEKFPLPFKHN